MFTIFVSQSSEVVNRGIVVIGMLSLQSWPRWTGSIYTEKTIHDRPPLRKERAVRGGMRNVRRNNGTREENRGEMKERKRKQSVVVVRVSQPPIVYPTTRFLANRCSQQNLPTHHYLFLRRLGFILKSILLDVILELNRPIHGCICHLRFLRAVRSPPRGDQHAVRSRISCHSDSGKHEERGDCH